MRILFTIGLMFQISLVCGQQYIVTGVVADASDRSTLPGASVLLLQDNPNTLPAGTSTRDDGSFRIELPAGNHTLRISFLGYLSDTIPLTVSGPEDLGIILLNPDIRMLETVEIIDQVQQVTIRGDTTQFNAAAFKTNPDASVQDLVEKLPGIDVIDGKVQSQGEDVTQVLVDGKPFMGNDPNAALKQLPADAVDKIQLYDAPDEQSEATGFDNGETRKTINIVTKEVYRNGIFGRVNGGYGTDNRYQAGAVINRFNHEQRFNVLAQSNNINEQNFSTEALSGISGRVSNEGGDGRRRRGGSAGNTGDFMVDQQGGITTTHAAGINYNDTWGEKTEINGSYFYNQGETQSILNLYRSYVTGLPLAYEESNHSISDSRQHRFNLRLDHNISERSRIRYRPSFNMQVINGDAGVFARTYQEDLLIGQTQSLLVTRLLTGTLEQDLSWRHRFSKEGRSVSVQLEHAYSPVRGLSELDAQFQEDSAGALNMLQQSDLITNEQKFGGSIFYSEPLGEHMQLQLNYSHQHQYGNAERVTRVFDAPAGDFIPDDSLLSSRYDTRFITQSGGAGVIYAGEKLNLTLNGELQYADFISNQEFPFTSRTVYSFPAFLPSARLRYRISSSKNLQVFYRTSTRPPSAGQLQYVIDNTNLLNWYAGNPELKPIYSHNTTIRYAGNDTVRNTYFAASVSAGYSRNFIGNNTIIAAHDTLLGGNVLLPSGTQFTQPVNLGDAWNLRLFTSYGLPAALIRSKINLNLSLRYSRTPGMINGILNYNSIPGADAGITISSNISERLDYTLSSRTGFNRPDFSYNSRTESYLTQNTRARIYAGITRNLVFRTEMTHRYISGIAGGMANNFLLLNLSLGWKFLERQQAEIFLSVFDALQMNRDVERVVTETYIEDQEMLSLQRFFMLNFTWNFRYFPQVRNQ